MSQVQTVTQQAAAPSAQNDGYVVQHGDTLAKIAAQHGVSLSELEGANPQIRNPNLIYPGEQVTIPGGQSSSGANGTSGPSGSQAAAPSGATPSTLQGREDQAMGYFMSQGWSREQAAGIVANLEVESAHTLDPHIQQYGGGPGYGIAQWEGPRQAQFQQVMGKDIHNASYGDELQFVQWELTHSESSAGNALRTQTSAYGAGMSVLNNYERPADRNQPARGELAQQIFDRSHPTTGGGAPAPAPAPSPAPAPAPSGGSYTVHSGDTLSSIANRFHVGLGALIAANPQISNPNLIHAGQTIHLPGHAAASGGSDYAVQRGDTMSGIANKFGVSLGSLLGANPQISNPNLIYPGQTVHVPGGHGAASTAPVDGSASTGAVKGTNAASIAQKYLGRYESDLQRSGVTQAGVDTSESCANFVTSMLKDSGQINWHTNLVSDLNTRLRGQGWHQVSLADAKPGDVWICNGAHGESHTEIVSSNDGHGHVTLIGSNNHPDPGNQQINYDSYSANISGSFILAPP
ncbi:MAG: LysM peptidoglycan-binding domain-containing protein [Rudaea sp.]|uniref:phage tail tip lysozyme n=1 Tax=unclassified Rudaea TaxID=2627037 RepID=UPI0010F69348|nr:MULTISPECIES: phage tail tip lysozyme [unclassified Rudaea]MBN8887459.1 LysM peptidoglycan-binding domain-containing protein [Rudaea sp.]